MEFKGPYLNAMRDQAPAMFQNLQKTGALDAMAQKKSVEAHSLYEELTKGEPRTPSGVVIDPVTRQTAERNVLDQLLDFPPPEQDPAQEP